MAKILTNCRESHHLLKTLLFTFGFRTFWLDLLQSVTN